MSKDSPTPLTISSTVSMFIEDSRVRAVANSSQVSPCPWRQRTFSKSSDTTNEIEKGAKTDKGRTSALHGFRSARPINRPAFLAGPKSINRSNKADPSVKAACSSTSTGDKPSEVSHYSIERAPVQRATATLTIQPAPYGTKSVKKSTIVHANPDKSYTTVNLTMRSPTTGSDKCFPNVNLNAVTTDSDTSISFDGGSGAGTMLIPIVHRYNSSNCRDPVSGKNHGRGGHVCTVCSSNQSVTYSSFSNSKDGFETQLQIQIGRGGSTFSATRRRGSGKMSVQNSSQQLMNAQRKKRDRLKELLEQKKVEVADLNKKNEDMKTELGPHFEERVVHLLEDLKNTKKENEWLSIDCRKMKDELDYYSKGSGITFGKGFDGEMLKRLMTTNSDRMRSLSTEDVPSMLKENQRGRRSSELSPRFNEIYDDYTGEWRQHEPSARVPPPRPPPPNKNVLLALKTKPESLDGWNCSQCTFLNHFDLPTCEQCNMLRI